MDLSSDIPLLSTCTSNTRSFDFPRVYRRHNHLHKPYSKPRRLSFQLAGRKDDPSSTSAGELNVSFGRGLNLSDSEGSSGTGSNTPPQIYPQNFGSNPCFESSASKSTKFNSNPDKENKSREGSRSTRCSPTKRIAHNLFTDTVYSEDMDPHLNTHSLPLSTSSSTETQQGTEGVMVRSKSLDDLNLILVTTASCRGKCLHPAHDLPKLFPFHGTIARTQGATSCDIESVLQRISQLEM